MPYYEKGIFISSEAIVHIEAAFFKLELNITVQVFMNRATFSPIERASARISIRRNRIRIAPVSCSKGTLPPPSSLSHSLSQLDHAKSVSHINEMLRKQVSEMKGAQDET